MTLPTAGFDISVASTTKIILPVTTTQIDAFPNPGPNPTPNPGDPGYVGFQGDFRFDSAVVTFQSPFVQAAGLTATNWNVSGNIINSGPGTTKVLRVSAFSLDFTPLSGSGTLFNLIFRRVSFVSGNTSKLNWQPPPDNNFQFIYDQLNTVSPGQNNGLITITGATPTPGPDCNPNPNTGATYANSNNCTADTDAKCDANWDAVQRMHTATNRDADAVANTIIYTWPNRNSATHPVRRGLL